MELLCPRPSHTRQCLGGRSLRGKTGSWTSCTGLDDKCKCVHLLLLRQRQLQPQPRRPQMQHSNHNRNRCHNHKHNPKPNPTGAAVVQPQPQERQQERQVPTVLLVRMHPDQHINIHRVRGPAWGPLSMSLTTLLGKSCCVVLRLRLPPILSVAVAESKQGYRYLLTPFRQQQMHKVEMHKVEMCKPKVEMLDQHQGHRRHHDIAAAEPALVATRSRLRRHLSF